MPRLSILLTILCFMVASPATDALADSNTAARLWLVDGSVLDWDTGEPIKKFRVLPGLPFRQDEEIKRSNSAVWQPHQIREMSDGKFQWPRTSGYKDMRFRVEADGYQPAMTPWTQRGGPYTKMRVYLRRDTGIFGTVVDADGMPVSGAVFSIGIPNRPITIDGTTIKGAGAQRTRLSDRWRVPVTVSSDDKGTFRIPIESDPSAVVCIVHESGILTQSFEEIRELDASGKKIQLQLQRWSIVSGNVAWKDKPAADALILCTTSEKFSYTGLITSSQRTRTDDQGNFQFEFVPPGECEIARRVEKPGEGTVRPIGSELTVDYPKFAVDVSPGEKNEIHIGGPGVTLTGNLVGLNAYDGLSVTITPLIAGANVPNEIALPNIAGRRMDAIETMRKSIEGKYYFRNRVPVAADGSFALDDILSGSYYLNVVGADGGCVFSIKLSDCNDVHIGRITVGDVVGLNR